ncbi:MAG: ion channel family protein [Herminiimonas sp.]|nr:ion channel family protein [Herminiimonas sp.]
MYITTGQQIRLAAKLLSILAVAIFVFGCAYYALTNIPQQGLNRATDDATFTFADCVYFSVVTIATLGYGDLVPVGWSRLVASVETIFGLVFVGYAISQVVSAKQEALIGYMANGQIIQAYDSLLVAIADAKELIGDRRRLIQAGVPIDPIDYLYNRSNPFYPALNATLALIGYTAHVEAIGKIGVMADRVERAAHHVEELAGFTRKLVNLLVVHRAEWRTHRTRLILSSLCDAVESFSERYVKHTRYVVDGYKGGGLYKDIVAKTTSDIRANLLGATVKQRHDGQK